MTRVNYQDHVINANTRQLSDDGRWTLDIIIEHHFGAGVDMTTYSARNTFATKDEAIEHCFNFGRQIIDGKVPNCSAPRPAV